MNETPLLSSLLSGFRYDAARQQLRLRFRKGDLYIYQTVPAAVAKALLDAPSPGEYFNSAIRNRFPFRRLS
jgi:lysyl-tRNA synthetase, class II